LSKERFQSDESDAIAVRHKPLSTFDWIAGFLILIGAAAIVVWQNSRLAVLWDLSYILENAHRIALGEIPYRDFPFPYAPLTFLIQAGLIKLTGPVFWHTTFYCAILNGLSGVLTWRILVRVLWEAGLTSRWLAILLTLPLIPLGVYSIFPHPFYDPDCTVAILFAVYLLQRAGISSARDGARFLASFWPLVAGAALVIPLFVKQNTGLAFIVSAVLSLFFLMLIGRDRQLLRRYTLTIPGAVVMIVLALGLIIWIAGGKNYWHWTIEFAASRRTPGRADMLGIYSDRFLLLWLGFVAGGAALVWLARRQRNRLLRIGSALLIATPFVWPAIYLLRDNDPSERAERLVNVWPLLIIFSFILALITIKRRKGIAIILPFVLIATIHGAFMSQQLWGSTYAIWPLFVILLAATIADLNRTRSDAEGLSQPNRYTSPQAKLNDDLYWFQMPLVCLIVLSLLISGGFYLQSHERLDYANLDDGELKRSSLPQLKGMATRGDWIPNFEELIRYTDAHIPRDEGILVLPGEDLFYFATGRTPKFPVLMFDHTVNPYSPVEIRHIAQVRDIRWLIVKQEIQDEDEEIEKLRDELTDALEEDFEQGDSLDNYEIYHRRDPSTKDDDDNNDERK